MSIPNGLTSQGFGLKPLSEILSDLSTEQKNLISGDLNTSSTSVLGILNGIMAERLYSMWELGQAIYNALNPDAASGVPLENISAISGITRLPATKGTGTITCSSTNGCTVPAGYLVATVDTGDQFVIDNDIVVPAGVPTDGTVTAVEYGEIPAYAGQLTVIVNSFPNWDSVNNAGDIAAGRDIETDEALRIRREAALAVAGASTVDAIIADLLLVSDVEEVFVLENTTDVTDGNGIPPHAFETIVLGGTAQDVADSIWSNKPAGIATHGDETQAITDSQGYSHDVEFTRPTAVEIHIKITLTEGPNYEGDAAVKTALLAYGATLGIADDVIYWKVGESVGDLDIADVTDLQIEADAVGVPVGTSNISIGTYEVSEWDTTYITVAKT